MRGRSNAVRASFRAPGHGSFGKGSHLGGCLLVSLSGLAKEMVYQEEHRHSL